jgi:hypothetical protein
MRRVWHLIFWHLIFSAFNPQSAIEHVASIAFAVRANTQYAVSDPCFFDKGIETGSKDVAQVNQAQ